MLPVVLCIAAGRAAVTLKREASCVTTGARKFRSYTSLHAPLASLQHCCMRLCMKGLLLKHQQCKRTAGQQLWMQ